MRWVSAVDQFAGWRFYRSWLVPIFLLVALLSIVFRGALPPHVGVLLGSLIFASLVMVMHAAYLALMAYHLVYRFPVERPQTTGWLFALIMVAYVAYAGYDFAVAKGGDFAHWAGFFKILGSGAFAFVYLAMARHGWHEGHERPLKPVGAPGSEVVPSRLTRRERQRWMLRTDAAMCLLTVFVFAKAVLHVPLPKLPIGTGWESNWASAVLQKGSAKDVIIFSALVLFVLGQRRAKRLVGQSQSARHGDVQKLNRNLEVERINAEGSTVAVSAVELAADLPERAVWLDVGSLKGVLLMELLASMGKDTDPVWPTEIISLSERDLGSTPIDVVQKCAVIHMAHAAYRLDVVRAVIRLLRHASKDACLLVRYTAGGTFYRAVSASMACSPIAPYSYHVSHLLLLEELVREGWHEHWRARIARECTIAEAKDRALIVNWCDAQYGEFSGDVIERYLEAFSRAGITHVPNHDFVVLLSKRPSSPVVAPPPLHAAGEPDRTTDSPS